MTSGPGGRVLVGGRGGLGQGHPAAALRKDGGGGLDPCGRSDPPVPIAGETPVPGDFCRMPGGRESPDQCQIREPRVFGQDGACTLHLPLAFSRIVDLAAGLVAVLWPAITLVALIWLVAIWAVVTGALMLSAAFTLNIDHGRWWLALGGIASIIFGILLVVEPLIGAVVLVVLRARGVRRTGRPSFSLLWVGVPLVVVPALGWLLVSGKPLLVDLPEMVTKSGGVLKVEGGTALSSEFTALLLGLVVYTGAFIAEVVRAGILAVPKGQTEAARAQGFTGGQILRLIVLPQALRVIIPPLISQYLNLTKNSSLAIGIGFLDLYAVSNTMLNQSGRVVEVFLMIMGSYLSMSLTISLVMNIVNRRIQIVER